MMDTLYIYNITALCHILFYCLVNMTFEVYLCHQGGSKDYLKIVCTLHFGMWIFFFV